MSGIAQILRHRGHTVTGSDLQSSPLTEKIEGLGVTVYRGHDGLREWLRDMPGEVAAKTRRRLPEFSSGRAVPRHGPESFGRAPRRALADSGDRPEGIDDNSDGTRGRLEQNPGKERPVGSVSDGGQALLPLENNHC